MKAFNQIRNAADLLRNYKGKEPLSLYLKQEFRKRPQFGSGDRRLMRELCISALKTGLGLREKDIEHSILIGYFLNNQVWHPAVEWLAGELQHAEWIPLIDASFFEKLTAVKDSWQVESFFPFSDKVGDGIDSITFAAHFFQKPVTWIRVKPKGLEALEQFLHSQHLEPLRIPEYIYAFGMPAGIDIDAWPSSVKSSVEIQDLASQLTLQQLPIESGMKIWDCCAASGGKTLLLHASYPGLELYVSDVRKQILQQLEERFAPVGLGNVLRAQVDLAKPVSEIIFENKRERKVVKKEWFDFIVADVPCSGSGTWRRNPERLRQITSDELEQYVVLQQQVAQHASMFLKKGGRMVYLTCSRYAVENEDQVAALVASGKFTQESATYIRTMDQGGDVMFRAVLRRN